MKFIFGLFLILLITEKGNANDVVSRTVRSFRRENQDDSSVHLFKAERVFVPADPKSSAPTNIFLEEFYAPQGYGVNYVEVFESLKPEYAGAKNAVVGKAKTANPPWVQVIFTNSAGKGIDARVLYYVYKN